MCTVFFLETLFWTFAESADFANMHVCDLDIDYLLGEAIMACSITVSSSNPSQISKYHHR